MGGAVLAIANAWLISYDVNQWDESWMLQVARRVADGDALYGEVWFGATPLSVYLLSAVVAIVDAQILAVKALSAILAAGSALLVARIALQGGATRVAGVVSALLMLPLAPAASSALYTPLAMFLFLACESIALTVLARPSVAGTALAGGVAGLAFAAKQNVGALAILVLVGTLMLADPLRGGARRAFTAVATFLAVAAVAVGTMVATGGVRNALDALGLGKGTYLELGAIHYHDVLLDHLKTLARPRSWLDQFTGRDRDLFLASPKVVLPVLTALVLAAAWVAWATRKSRPRTPNPRLGAVTLFAAASFLVAFPRYDTLHLGWTAGPLLAACAVSLGFLSPRPGRGLRVVVVGVAVAWAAFALAGPLSDWRSSDLTRVGLPHYAGAWTSRQQHERDAEAVRRLRDELLERRVFIATGNASFFYLAAQLENPTRYDYPASTTIRERDVDEILRGVAEGTVPAACLVEGSPGARESQLLELERRLRRLLRAGPDVGLCRLWFRARTS